ncbi:hypothetical protein J2T17_003425 [Paenibacillus mucilaginosus]|uniref:CBO0543 family protein n=1 Tax=Paenibacillus mucilaginosus TaxID=61624 RepID=UPI003D1EEC21
MDRQQLNEQLADLFQQLFAVHLSLVKLWRSEIFLHWDWWLTLALTVLPWLLWIPLRQKDSTSRLLHAGFFVLIITSWLDFMGLMFGAWYYGGLLIPTMPTYIPYDFCLFPVIVMLLLQYKPKAPVWIKAAAFGLFCSYIGEPLLHALGLYFMIWWRYSYSVPIYTLIYAAAHWISRRRSFHPLKS